MASTHQYPVERSKVSLRDQAHKDNLANWEPILEKYENALQQVSSEGTLASLERHQTRGQLLRESSSTRCGGYANRPAARDRIALLLDQDSPFLELCPFAGFGNANSTPSANIIAGIGTVR